MTDRPTPPEPDRPDVDQPGADATAALPQSGPAATAPIPPRAPAAEQVQGPGPSAAQPAADWPGGGAPTSSAAAPAGARPGGPRRWWDDATSTGAGRGALIAVAVLGSLLLVAGVGLTAALVAGHDRWDRDERGWTSDDRGPGTGQGNGKGKVAGRDGDAPRGRQGRQADPTDPGNPGDGSGTGTGRGAGRLGDVLHGEYTTNVTGTPTAMVVQTGEVTAYTAGTSLTVKSPDGFEATYALDGTIPTTRGTTALATGVQVRVVAVKEGMKVTRLVVR
ncbi:MAG TPA: hypothetical protein VLQ78_05845 [Ornithinibacter sp.]|nr:hypothetical protein [Ornithinibacter sp.]